MNVSLQDAYDKACELLGAAVIREALLAPELDRLTAENASLRAEVAAQSDQGSTSE